MTTSTKNPRMHPFLPPRGSEALSILHQGGLVLLPTANLWQLVSHPHFPYATQRQLELCPPTHSNRPELLFYDLELLKEWVPNLHPKLETLLLFHRRALTLLVEVPMANPALQDDRGLTAVRLIQDSFCYCLGEDLELPLLASVAQAAGDATLPLRFGQIRSDILQGADYVVRRRQLETLDVAPTVMVCLNKNDEVVFVRE